MAERLDKLNTIARPQGLAERRTRFRLDLALLPVTMAAE
jgi:hypothetical protein